MVSTLLKWKKVLKSYRQETERGKTKLSIKVLTIINPSSGKGNILEKVDEIKKNIEEQKMEIDIQYTK